MTKDNNCCSGKNLFGSLGLLCLGVILLLNNFNLLPWTVWSALWRFWPVFLIVWGLETIFGQGSWGKTTILVISILILLCITVYSVSLVDSGFRSWLRKYIPGWGNINWTLPEDNFGFRSRGRLYCDPLDDSCTVRLR